MARRPVEERLGLLAAKTNDPTAIFTGGIDLSVFDGYDIAAALNANGSKGIGRGPYLFALAKYAGDESVIDELAGLVYRMVIQTANKNGWQTKHRKGLRRLSELALIEAEIVPQRCGQCKGRQFVIRASQVVPCEACGGTGNYRRSMRARARYLGVDHKGFAHTWAGRLQLITSRLAGWEIEVVDKLIEELR